MQPRHHGSCRNRECVGYLLVGHIFNVGKNDNLLKLPGYALERVQHFLFSQVLRRRRLVSYCFGNLLLAVSTHTQTILTTSPFTQCVVHDLDQPGATVGTFLETTKRSQPRQKSLLHKIFGFVAIRQQPLRHSVEIGTVWQSFVLKRSPFLRVCLRSCESEHQAERRSLSPPIIDS